MLESSCAWIPKIKEPSSLKQGREQVTGRHAFVIYDTENEWPFTILSDNHIPVVLYIQGKFSLLFTAKLQNGHALKCLKSNMRLCSWQSITLTLHFSSCGQHTLSKSFLKELEKGSYSLPEVYSIHLLCLSRTYAQKHGQLFFIKRLRRVT